MENFILKYISIYNMTKDKFETIRETPTIVKKEIVKTCSCNKDIGRNIKCPDHGDPDKI